MKRILSLLLSLVVLLGIITAWPVSAAEVSTVSAPAQVIDAAMVLKDHWILVDDRDNVGEEKKWYEGYPAVGQEVSLPNRSESTARGADTAWYFNTFTPDFNLCEGQRVIAHFEGCQYYTKVWFNGTYLGDHEGTNAKFSFDLTGLIREDQENMMAIRVFSPLGGSSVRGDAVTTLPIWNGSTPLIQTPVYLTVVPDLAIADVFVDTKYASGDVNVQVIVDNPGSETVSVTIGAQISPYNQNTILDESIKTVEATPGLSEHVVTMNVEDFHAWSPDDPYLYSTRVTVQAEAASFMDSTVIQVGFKDLRIDDNGNFVLNGERMYVKSLHTSVNSNNSTNNNGVGVELDRLYKQFDYYKSCGFTMVRFIASPAIPEMLDYCDKIGLLVYQEIGFAWKDETEYAEDLIRREARQVIERDRNHASFAIVGLLNETYDNDVIYEALNNYRSAVNALDVCRTYDNDVLVMLSSGRWDYDGSTASASNPGSWTWNAYLGNEGVANEDGSYTSEGGDIHIYPRMPFDSSIRQSIADLGKDAKRSVLISESGIGSQANLVSGVRIWQQESKGTFNASAYDRGVRQVSTLYKLYNTYNMAEAYGTPELLIRDTQVRQAELRTLIFDFIRSNPRINGYSLTQGNDNGQRGEGILETTYDFKDGMFAAMIDGWADTRWCLNIDHYNVYNTQTLDVDIYLSDLGALEIKEYTARFTISGDDGVVWEKELPVTIERDKNGNYISAIQVLCENIPLTNLPTGEYRINANLVGTGVSGTKLFWVTDVSNLPKVSGTVYVTGFKDNKALSLMKDAGLDVQELDINNIVPGCTILLGGKNMKNRELKTIYASVEAHGTTVAGINGAAYGDWSFANIPLGSQIFQQKRDNWLYHYDTMMLNTTLINGLADAGIASSVYYEDVYPNTCFNIPVEPREALAVDMYIGVLGSTADNELFNGVVAGAYDYGKGTIFVHTFRIMDNLGTPVADRMLLNMVDYVVNEC